MLFIKWLVSRYQKIIDRNDTVPNHFRHAFYLHLNAAIRAFSSFGIMLSATRCDTVWKKTREPIKWTCRTARHIMCLMWKSVSLVQLTLDVWSSNIANGGGNNHKKQPNPSTLIHSTWHKKTYSYCILYNFNQKAVALHFRTFLFRNI